MPQSSLYDLGYYGDNNAAYHGNNQAALMNNQQQLTRGLAAQQPMTQQMMGGSSQFAASTTSATMQFASSNVSLTSTTSGTWQLWMSNTTWDNTSYTAINATWDGWAMQRVYQCDYVQPPPETAEQRIAREEREVRHLAQITADKERRAAAIVKADKLLDSILNEVQRAHMQAHGYFVVRGRSGKLYRIRRGWSGNVDEICAKTGRVQQVYCAHPTSYMPDGDLMAAQKLMLESVDETLFLRTANRHGAHGPRVPSEVLERLVVA